MFTSFYLDRFYELMKLAVVKFVGITECTIDWLNVEFWMYV